jgi:heme-degrading monooxygenase HmoA
MHAIVWRFAVKADRRAAFEEHYGPQGTWARFFAQAPEFVRTELLRGGGNEYLTIDYWTSADAFLSFRDAHRAEYEEIDRRFEALTEREERVGVFEVVAKASS